MNPLGFLVIGLGILLVIVGVKGSQHNLASALTRKPTGVTSTKPTASTPTGGTATPPGTQIL